MSRKSLAIGIIIGLVIAVPIGYALLQTFSTKQQSTSSNQQQSTSNNYAGYKEVKAYENGFGPNFQQFGDYKYFLYYYPNLIQGNVTYAGYLMIWREDVIGSTDFNLTLNVSHNYYGITFVITELHPEYCVLMVKVITS
jgi:hypothetical protein